MVVIVAVNVIAPVIVAALVNGNDAVAAIDAVNEHATCDGISRATRTWQISSGGPRSRFHRTSRGLRPYNAARQGEALHDRQRLGDGMCFAPRRHEDR